MTLFIAYSWFMVDAWMRRGGWRDEHSPSGAAANLTGVDAIARVDLSSSLCSTQPSQVSAEKVSKRHRSERCTWPSQGEQIAWLMCFLLQRKTVHLWFFVDLAATLAFWSCQDELVFLIYIRLNLASCRIGYTPPDKLLKRSTAATLSWFSVFTHMWS